MKLRLSWLAPRLNRYPIEGEQGSIEWNIYDLDRVSVTPHGGRTRVVRANRSPAGFDALCHDVLRDFLKVLGGECDSPVSVDDALVTMALMECCYGERELFSMPWHRFTWSTSAGQA